MLLPSPMEVATWQETQNPTLRLSSCLTYKKQQIVFLSCTFTLTQSWHTYSTGHTPSEAGRLQRASHCCNEVTARNLNDEKKQLKRMTSYIHHIVFCGFLLHSIKLDCLSAQQQGNNLVNYNENPKELWQILHRNSRKNDVCAKGKLKSG